MSHDPRIQTILDAVAQALKGAGLDATATGGSACEAEPEPFCCEGGCCAGGCCNTIVVVCACTP
jgi:hypothetical protein